jgi:drug/metabolite transporter (DMT)-like permease
MASARFLLAGAVLYAFCLVRGQGRATREELVRALVTGATLLLFGNGLTAWTVQYLPSGLNSLLLSCAPIWMAMIAYAWGRERPTRVGIAGMVLGLGGLVLLLQPNASGNIALVPALVAVFASLSWSFGSIYQRRAGPTRNLVLATALQMLAGGGLLAIEAAFTGEWRALDVHAITAVSLGGFLWLVVFGSIIAYSAYLYTMHAASTALASTYAYVNPIVALVLGFALFGERLTLAELGASAVIVVGVALMMLPAPRRSAAL